MNNIKQISRIVIAMTLIISCSFIISHYIDAASSGTSADPLVAQSYVDKKINELSARITSLESSLKKVSAGKYITVKKGKTLVMKVGCQVIVYSGSVKTVGPKGTNLTNATTGAKVSIGKVVPTRNILVSAVSDTRGIYASKEAKVLVSGSYTIK